MNIDICLSLSQFNMNPPIFTKGNFYVVKSTQSVNSRTRSQRSSDARRRVVEFAETLRDSAHAGSEAYQAALVFYNSVKFAAAQGVSGAKAVYDELKKRFPGGKRRTTENA
jgi:TolA-binding protein